VEAEYVWERPIADRFARLYEEFGVSSSPAVPFAHAPIAA